jgi:glyoxylase-like metal-dependent hydrolase (beta-lactamase superfamily II)
MFVAPDIIQVRIPLPFSLKFVNCYLVRGPGGWALIDTGIHWPPAIAAWHETLDELDLPFSAIREIYVTHHHVDHVGLAGWWQQASGAAVFMTAGEALMVQRIWRDRRARRLEIEFFVRHGMPQPYAAALVEQTASAYEMTQPLPDVTMLHSLRGDPEALAPLEIVGRTFQPLICAGHADDQLLLYEPATRTLFCADHVLPRISPNISIFPDTRPDPLGRFLSSFPALAGLDVATALPGHGAIFHNLSGRMAELHAHHLVRLDEMLAAIGARATGYEVATRVFPLDALSSHQVQFALGETLAHLDYLVVQGRAELVEEEAPSYRPR